MKPADFKRAITTCTAWYQESIRSGSIFQHKFNINIKNCALIDNTHLEYIFNGIRCFKSITFQYVSFESFNAAEAMKDEFRNNIESLTLHNCNITFEQFVKLIVQLPNLNSLAIEFCNFRNQFFLSPDNFSDKHDLYPKYSDSMNKLKRLKLVVTELYDEMFRSLFINTVANLEEFSYKIFPYPNDLHIIGEVVDKNSNLKKLELYNEIPWYHADNEEYKVSNLKDVYLVNRYNNLESFFVENRTIERLKVQQLSSFTGTCIYTYLNNMKQFEIYQFLDDDDEGDEAALLTWLNELQEIQVSI